MDEEEDFVIKSSHKNKKRTLSFGNLCNEKKRVGRSPAEKSKISVSK